MRHDKASPTKNKRRSYSTGRIESRRHRVTGISDTGRPESQSHGVMVSESRRIGEAEGQRKRGVRLESPAVPYISTPDGLFWTKGVFFGA